jgi:hypothetical protein
MAKALWFIIWLIILLIFSFWIAGFIAFFYIILYPITVCIPDIAVSIVDDLQHGAMASACLRRTFEVFKHRK